MAGLRGNIGWLAAAKQTGKGVVGTLSPTNGFKSPFEGGSIGPVRATGNLAETDSSRDQGIAYVQNSGVEGSPAIYVRDASIAFWLRTAFGAIATTGTTPNFVHTITPSNALPYITVWRDQSDVLYEQFVDCKVSSIAIAAEAGNPLVATLGIQGLTPTRLAVAPDNASPVPVESGAVYNYNNATVTLGGGVTALVRSFELTYDNNVTRQQTNNVVPYDVVEGQRQVTLGFDLIFETLDEYNKFHYGGVSGTTVSPTIFTTSALFSFDLGANNSVAFNLPSIAYEEFPVEPQPGGDPVTVSVRAVGLRGASPICTATVKNQNAGTLYA